MAWFKKREDEELSELPELPELESVMPKTEKMEKSYLPSLPPPSSQMMSASVVKDTMNIGFKPLAAPKEDASFKRSIEISSQSLQKFPQKAMRSTPVLKEPSLPAGLKKNEPIFVRIDKFESALEGIKNIKKKVDEMESLLTNLRQVNAKEDLELSEWEREISEIKAKIESIDADLFGKLG